MRGATIALCRRSTFAVALCSLLFPGRAWSQRLDSLPQGTRVRVELPTEQGQMANARTNAFLIGQLGRVSAQSLSVRLVGVTDSVLIARADIRSFAVSKGRSRAVPAVQWAVFSGLAAFVVTSLSDASASSVWQLTGASALAGAIRGARSADERWRELRAP